MNKTKIDWATHTCNPVCGCTYGCEFCYARKMNNRFGWIKDFSKPEFFPERIKMLYSKTPKVIFMDSMSDIADWELEWIEQIFKAINDNPQHKYLFLTKRYLVFFEKEYLLYSQRKIKIMQEDLYFGISVTNQKDVPTTFSENADFWSIEPILGPIVCNFAIACPTMWVIIGAETGNRKNKVIPKREWIESIVEQCREAKIPIFMKSSLKNIWNEPLIQEYPWVTK